MNNSVEFKLPEHTDSNTSEDPDEAINATVT